MAAKTSKKSGKKPAGKPDPAGDPVEDTPEVQDPAGRRPLVRNINIDGTWYGPAHGNATDYPDHGHDGRPELFGNPEQLNGD